MVNCVNTLSHEMLESQAPIYLQQPAEQKARQGHCLTQSTAKGQTHYLRTESPTKLANTAYCLPNAFGGPVRRSLNVLVPQTLSPLDDLASILRRSPRDVIDARVDDVIVPRDGDSGVLVVCGWY